MENPKTASDFRNEVYAYLKDHDVEVPNNVKGGLSKVLKSVYEHRVIERTDNHSPTEHHIICIMCLSVKMVIGKKGKVYVKALKYARDVAVRGFIVSGHRQNLLDLVEKAPAMIGDAVDAAYVAGLDDAKPLYEPEKDSV